MSSNEELGRLAYEAYCDARAWRAFDGTQLKSWIIVDRPIQQAWIKSAVAIRERVHNETRAEVHKERHGVYPR